MVDIETLAIHVFNTNPQPLDNFPEGIARKAIAIIKVISYLKAIVDD